jgi:hypothetical protein
MIRHVSISIGQNLRQAALGLTASDSQKDPIVFSRVSRRRSRSQPNFDPDISPLISMCCLSFLLQLSKQPQNDHEHTTNGKNLGS